jgi:thiol:disulfide interchange protein DsbD
MKHSFPFFSLFIALFVLEAPAFSNTVPFYENLPHKVKEAVSIRHQIVERKLSTDLNGLYKAQIKVDLEVETRNRFLIYQDNFDYQIAEHQDHFDNEERWQLKKGPPPETVRFLDPVSKKLKKGYKGQNIFSLQINTPEGYFGIPENYKVPLVVSFQACSERQCLLPQKVLLEIDFFDPKGGRLGKSDSQEFEKSFLTRVSSTLSSGLKQSKGLSFSILLILFVAGLLTAFTPCVYPIYPITLGIFSRWSHNSSSHGLYLSLFYCLGMILSYAIFGLITAATGAVFGSLTQQPLYLISIGAIFLISAVFFSGLINLPVPTFLQNFFGSNLESSEKKVSLPKLCTKAAFMGMGMGILAAPCVGPVLLALLAWLSQSLQNDESAYLKGFLLLSTFGLGMSVPFLILGHFILRMKKKVSLGRFTPWVKHAGTAFLVAGSLFFIIPGVKLLTPGEKRVALEFAFPVYNLENQVKGQWTVYDFRADWCVACLELEEKTFMEKRISEQFESGEWVYVQIDMTKMDDQNKKIAEKFSVISLPSVFILNPKGEQCVNLNLHEFESAPKFLARMKEAKRNCLIPPVEKGS